MQERTLSIIKPDGTERNLVGKVLSRIEEKGLRIAAMQMRWLSRRETEGFYAIHRGKPFYDGLINYMTSGPVVVAVLEGDDAIHRWREIMGPTDPAKAPEGTIRKDFARTMQQNTCHGSDAPETAAAEIRFFFPDTAIMSNF